MGILKKTRVIIFLVAVIALAFFLTRGKMSITAPEGTKGETTSMDSHQGSRKVYDFETCVENGGKVDENYPDQCVYEGDMVFVRDLTFSGGDDLGERLKSIQAVVEVNEEGQRELVFPDFPVRPIKALSVDVRNDFQNAILAETGGERTKRAILSAFPGLQEEDFKNTGSLEDDIDFQILLNNYLERSGLNPQNGEQLERIVEDLKEGGGE